MCFPTLQLRRVTNFVVDCNKVLSDYNSTLGSQVPLQVSGDYSASWKGSANVWTNPTEKIVFWSQIQLELPVTFWQCMTYGLPKITKCVFRYPSWPELLHGAEQCSPRIHMPIVYLYWGGKGKTQVKGVYLPNLPRGAVQWTMLP